MHQPRILTDDRFLDRLIGQEPSLMHVVDLTRGGAGDELRCDTLKQTDKLQASIQERRDARAADEQQIDREMNAKYPTRRFDPSKPMSYI